jgi:type III secretion system low calcium response chaperone LcrH/SycD
MDSSKELMELQKQNEKDLEQAVFLPMVRQIMDSQPPSKVENPDQQFKRLMSQCKKSFGEYQDGFKSAGRLLNAAGYKPNFTETEEEAEARLKDVEDVDLLSIQELLNISEEDMDQMEKIAGDYYRKEEFQNSRDIFLFLTSIDSERWNYWLGLGMSEQMNKHYDMAATAYSMAADLNSADPSIHLYSANCLHLMNRKDEAINVLQLLIEGTAHDDEWSAIKKRAEELKTEWTKAA